MAEVLEPNDAGEPEAPAAPPRKARKKKTASKEEVICKSGSPTWMATFSDLATLLMAFFVLILSRSVIDSPKMEQVMGSVAKAFGVERIIPKIEIPMGETLLELDFTPSDAQDTLIVDPTQDSDDTSKDYIKAMTETGTAASLVQAQFKEVVEELEYEIEQGQVNVAIEGEKVIVQMTEGETGASGKKGRSQGGVSQETIEVAKKLFDMAGMDQSIVEMKREDNWEAKAREVTSLSSLEEISDAMQKEIEDGIAEVEQVGDSVLIRLTQADSFESGSATLSRSFETILQRVGDSLGDTIGTIRVEGHTDDQVVAFSERFRSNFDLSAARSAAVADFLTANTAIENGRITISGLADTKPITSNDTPEGRAQNRRIEIYLDE